MVTRVYYEVFCIEADVVRIIGKPEALPERGGFPGRPNSRHLIEAEIDRRITFLKAGEFLGPNIITVAESVSAWLKKTHPGERQAKAKSIKNAYGKKIGQHVPSRARK
jgi:hypothetical protein